MVIDIDECLILNIRAVCYSDEVKELLSYIGILEEFQHSFEIYGNHLQKMYEMKIITEDILIDYQKGRWDKVILHIL